MKLSLAGRIRNTVLNPSKPLVPVFEAIMNSAHAIEETGQSGGHLVRVHARRERGLDDNKHRPIDAFVISDTGAGFTQDNYDSFNTADSVYKQAKGGKGVGRFFWLKAFERVEVDSHYSVAGAKKLQRRRFTFEVAEEDSPCTLSESDRDTPLTTVTLSPYRRQYGEQCPRHLDVIAHRIVTHFLPLFMDPKGPSIILSDDNEEIDLNKLFRENYETLATRHPFSVQGRKFELRGFRLQGAATELHDIVFGAHYREVITERLVKYVPNLKNRLTDSKTQGQFWYLGFVQGEYLDEKVNSERSDFSILREPSSEAPSGGADQAGDLLSQEVSLKAIRDEAIKAVSADLKTYLDEINATKKAAVLDYIENNAPQYRVLLKRNENFINSIAPGASKSDLEAALHRELHNQQARLKEEGGRILAESTDVQNSEEFRKRFDKYITDENELGKTSLAQYVVHRRVILELLEKHLSVNPETGGYALERTVHSLVFPMKATSEEVPFEQQNLWILDERLTFHSFLSSDLALKTLAPLETEAESRPDILIFDRPLVFSEDAQPLSSMVVIEFKKPEKTQYDEDPISQVYRMVRDIRNGKMKGKDGRHIRPSHDNIPAYCYIVCDLPPPVEIRVQNMGARRTPDNQGYYGYNETLNAYYEIISYTKLLGDAKKRNRILFEKLNLPPQSK